MMTKTTLSDGRRTRPRFAASTPTPPKFLIETPRLEIAVSGRKTSQMQNPNRDKMGVFYPPQRLNGLQWYRPARRGGHSCLPRGTKGLCASAAPWIPRLPHTAASLPRTPWRNPASAMSRRFSSLVPIVYPEGRRALIHPRKLSGLSQSLIFTPFAPIHPRNELGARARSAAKSKTPAGCRRYKNPLAQSHPRKPLRLSRSLGFTPFAQPHPRKPSGLSQSHVFTPFAQRHPRNAVTPLPAAFSYRWLVLRYEGPPAGVFEVLSTSRPLFGLEPLVYPEGRRALIHPRNSQSAQVRSAERPKSPAGCRLYKNPLAPAHPREPLVSGVLQSNVGTSYTSLPFALLYPRNEQSGRARSAETSKTPARCRPYENPLLIVTPRLEIAATISKSKTMQNSNRYKMRVLHPPWRMCALPPPPTGALRRSANAASAPHLKTLIANARLEFNLSHSKENPLQISNRERMTVSQSRFRAPAQKGRRITIRASKVKLRFESRISASNFEPPASRT